MKRSALEVAFDVAAGRVDPDCAGCGRPSMRPRWAVEFRSPKDRLGECPECEEPVDWSGAPVVGVAPDGTRHLKRVFLFDARGANTNGTPD